MSCICAIATKLPKLLRGSSPDYVVSMVELRGTADVHTTSAITALVLFGHYCCLATVEHGDSGRKTTTDGDLYSGTVLFTDESSFYLDGSIVLLGNATGAAASPNDVTCHPGRQFEWTTVSGWGPQTTRFAIRGQARIMTLQKDNARTYVHKLPCTFSAVRISRLWNGRPCHQISGLKLSMSGMKWTVVCSSAVSRLARCENWEKLSVRCGRTSHRPSWQTWWRLCDGDVFLSLMPGMDTITTDNVNAVWAPLSNDVIKVYVNAPISSKLVVRSTTIIYAIVYAHNFMPKYFCVLS